MVHCFNCGQGMYNFVGVLMVMYKAASYGLLQGSPIMKNGAETGKLISKRRTTV